jgi:DNA-binding transcriptional ArsR family regulator
MTIFNRMVECCDRRLDLVFTAVADPTRRAILAALANKPATVTAIAKPFPTSLNAISKHLRTLERAGLIRRQIIGREHHCSLRARPLHDAMAWIEHYRSFWELRLDALERHVLAQKKKNRRPGITR